MFLRLDGAKGSRPARAVPGWCAPELGLDSHPPQSVRVDPSSPRELNRRVNEGRSGMADGVVEAAVSPVAGLKALAGRYDAVLCDVWGVIFTTASRPIARRRTPCSASASAGW